MAKRKSPLQPILDRLPTPFRNRYFVVSIFFLFWMIFFDKHDVLTQYRLQDSLERLEVDKKFYEEKIRLARKDRKDIQRDIGKFARERYYMHKENEDVFIFVEE